jgi:anti-sigma28 factor (negative regulator of flagellin synthesis)
MIKIPDGYMTVLAGSETVRKELRKTGADRSKSSPRAVADAVKISNRGHEVAHARSVALAAPDVRESLVNEIVGLISSGGYDVSGAQVAPKMIRDHAMDWMEQTS